METNEMQTNEEVEVDKVLRRRYKAKCPK